MGMGFVYLFSVYVCVYVCVCVCLLLYIVLFFQQTSISYYIREEEWFASVRQLMVLFYVCLRNVWLGIIVLVAVYVCV